MRHSVPLLKMVLIAASLGMSAHAAPPPKKDPCAFKPLNFKTVGRPAAQEARAGRRLVRMGPGEEPIRVRDAGSSAARPKRGCESTLNIVSEVYRNPKRPLLLVETYSGSDRAYQVIDALTCQPVGAAANFYGAAKLIHGRIEISPPCEGGITAERAVACTRGQVFTFDSKTCALSEDRAASRALTRKVLGVEIPEDLRIPVDVEWPATPRAKLTKHD